MRKTLLAWLILICFAPLAAGAPMDGDVVANSPAWLHGRVFVTAGSVHLYHHAFENGSLYGTVYEGALIDHRRESSCDGRPFETEVVVANVTSDNLAALMAFQVDSAAMVVADFDLHEKVPVMSGPPPEVDSAPDGYLAPNPYANRAPEAQSLRQTNPDPDRHALALPTQPFLVLPRRDFGSVERAVLSLESGNLSLTQFGETRTFRTGTTMEQRTCSTPVIGSSSRSTAVTHVYRLDLQLGVWTAQQRGLETTQEFYAGHRPAGDASRFGTRQPPAGYWYRGQGERMTDLYAEFSLPATMLTGDKLEVDVEGMVQLHKALGAYHEGENVTEVRDQDLVLGGTLHLVPERSDEGGRRMATHIDGDLLVVGFPVGGESQDWGPYLAGAAGGVALVGVAAYVWPFFKWHSTRFLLFPLYARLKKEDVLENPIRDDILQVVADQPGISASELGRRLECGWGTLVYHLTVLERLQLVSSTREGRHKRFFVQGRINYSDKGAVALLANPAARTILDAVRSRPGIIQKELSDRLGLSPGTIAWHIDRLTGQGLVVREEDGRSVRYYPSERLLQLTRQLAA